MAHPLGMVREVMLRAEAPSKKLLRGQGLARSSVNFDTSLITDRTSEWHHRLEQAFIDHKLTPPPPQAPSPKPAAAPSPKPPAAPAALLATPLAPFIPPAEWAAAIEKLKLSSTGKEFGGKHACHTYFVSGVCNKGTQCRNHHNGLAGVFRPKGC